jgi:hypothetical protein
MSRKTGSGVTEEGNRIENGITALFFWVDVRGRKVELAMNFAKSDEVVTPFMQKKFKMTIITVEFLCNV